MNVVSSQRSSAFGEHCPRRVRCASTYRWIRVAFCGALIALMGLASCQAAHRCWFVVDSSIGKVDQFVGANPEDSYLPVVRTAHVVGNHGLPGDVFKASGRGELGRAFPLVVKVYAEGALHEWRRVDAFDGTPVGYQHEDGGNLCWIRRPVSELYLWVVILSETPRVLQVVGVGEDGALQLTASPIVHLTSPVTDFSP